MLRAQCVKNIGWPFLGFGLAFFSGLRLKALEVESLGFQRLVLRFFKVKISVFKGCRFVLRTSCWALPVRA